MKIYWKNQYDIYLTDEYNVLKSYDIIHWFVGIQVNEKVALLLYT